MTVRLEKMTEEQKAAQREKARLKVRRQREKLGSAEWARRSREYRERFKENSRRRKEQADMMSELSSRINILLEQLKEAAEQGQRQREKLIFNAAALAEYARKRGFAKEWRKWKKS